jgi:hypothetical protein
MDGRTYRRWRPAFAATMDLRLYRPEWLDAQLMSGRAQFWCSPGAAAITEIRSYPTGVCDVHGLIAAGDLDELRDIIIPQVERWGRAVGALGIVIESRAGWARALRPVGFEPHQLAIRKELASEPRHCGGSVDGGIT